MLEINRQLLVNPNSHGGVKIPPKRIRIDNGKRAQAEGLR